MKFIFEHFWIPGLVVTIANIIFFYRRFKELSIEHPERWAGYKKILIAIAIILGTAVLLFGLADLYNDGEGLKAMDMKNNPVMRYGLGSYTAFLAIGGLIWIYFFKGADFLSRHPGVITYRGFGGSGTLDNPVWIKVFFTAMAVFGIVMLIIRW